MMLLIINGCYHLPQSDRRSSCRQLFCCVWDASGSKHCLGAGWRLRSCALCRACQTPAWRHSGRWRRGGPPSSWASWCLSSWLSVSLMSLCLTVGGWLARVTGWCLYLWSVICLCEWEPDYWPLACHGLSKQQLENEWSVSLSLSRLCPGPARWSGVGPSPARPGGDTSGVREDGQHPGHTRVRS